MRLSESTTAIAEEYGKRLNEQLLAGEYGQANALLTSLAEEAAEHTYTPENLCHILNEVVLVLTNVALHQDLSIVQLQRLYDAYCAWSQTGEEQTAFLQQVLPDFLRELCRSLREQDDLAVRMEHYIDAYAMDYTFSVKNMANYFSVSLIELRRVFYNKTGQHLREYIWERRLAKAKELLVNTDWSIREVVQSVGYIDVSNFTRKFRICTGMTPGEYRLAGGQNNRLA